LKKLFEMDELLDIIDDDPQEFEDLTLERFSVPMFSKGFYKGIIVKVAEGVLYVPIILYNDGEESRYDIDKAKLLENSEAENYFTEAINKLAKAKEQWLK